MKIVCLDAATLGEISLDKFREFGEFVAFDLSAKDEVISRLSAADVVLTNKVIIDKEIMDNTSLKLICITGTGMNNVDLNYAKSKGICVKNVAGYSTNSVTQQCFASLFYMANKMRYYDEWTKSGAWAKSKNFTNVTQNIYEIYGKIFGIIGLGTIGKSIAKIAQSFGANVVYFSTSGKNDNGEFKSVSLDELLKTCDIISINCALNEKTANLLGENELKKLKNGAILMNFARGGIVDENALVAEIDRREIYAILDVLEKEPMDKNSPFLKVKNSERLLITPHIAWASVEARQKLVELTYENIKNFVNFG